MVATDEPPAPTRERMSIALIGHGRMGREVEALALSAGHRIAARFDSTSAVDGTGPERESLTEADVAIDFSVPRAVLANVRAVADAGLPIVIGTTGWDADVPAAREIVESRGTGLVRGANFSIGANLFLELVRQAGGAFDGFEGFDPYVLEHHHRGKVDAPSGTALRLAEALLRAIRRKTRIQAGNPDGPIQADALQVASVRAGAAFGEHRVGFDAEDEAIELVHTARGRRGFARGALLAAEWILGRRGAFEFADVLADRRKGRT